MNANLQVFRFYHHAELHPPIADHLDYLLVDHVMDGHVDLRIVVAKHFERGGQQVRRERRHRGDGYLPQLEREMLAQQLFGTVPVRQQSPRDGRQQCPLRCQRHTAGGTYQQRPAEVAFQILYGQTQGWLREMQAQAGLGEAETVRHGEESTQLFNRHCFIILINGNKKQI